MNKKIGNLFKGDKVIWMVFFFLCMISIVEVFSASSNLTYKSQNYIGPIAFHTGTIIFGAAMAVFTLNIPCRYFKLMTPFLLIISGITLLWVLIGGESINGANRVISLPGGVTFQPSEIAKGTMVLITAQILSAMQREDGADKKAFKYILWIVLPTVALIGIENLSTAVLLLGVIFLMMFIGRVPMVQLGKLMGAGVIIVAIFLTLVLTLGSIGSDQEETKQTTEAVSGETDTKVIKGGGVFHRFVTWRNRIVKHLDKKDIAPDEYDLNKDAQVAHANIAIVSSNIIGKGPGQSVERDFLSQAFSDFIFAIVIEELGIIGAAFVVFLYIVLLYRAARIASRCENNFPAFLVMGLALLLVVQASFNMLVAVGIAPVTGQPLPLISKGGTSTIINCAYIGVILSVSRSAKKRTVKIAGMSKVLRVIISGGGTGGHIFPAISIANAIKALRPDACILFIGALGRMEMQRVPAAGYEIKGLPIRGFFRPLWKPANIGVAIDYLKSKWLAKKLLREFNPDVAVGVGGYASAAALGAANSLGIPTLIQEQNSYAGLTNKNLANKAEKICVAYEGMERFFPAEKIILTGNPVRQTLLDTATTKEDAIKSLGLDPSKKTILLVGGSLGARTINESMLQHLDVIKSSDVQFIWQTGKYYSAEIAERLKGQEISNLKVTDFITDMGVAYKAADLVISRAGASSISEFCLIGKPVILVPSPNVAEDHQTKNALALSTRDAAIYVKDAEAPATLLQLAIETVQDATKLKSLSENVLKLALPDSAEIIAKEVIKLAK